MKNRILTALLLLAIFIPIFLLRGIYMMLTVVVVIGLCIDELTAFRRKDWHFAITAYLGTCYIGLCFASAALYPWLLFVFIMSLFLISFITERFTVMDVLLYGSLSLILTFAGRSVLSLEKQGSLHLLYLVAVTYSVDTGGFFGGKFFGKHKLIERISPKKTWEGFFVGWFMGFAVSMLFLFIWPIFPAFLHIPASLLLAVTGQFGDLIFSSIKRFFQIKDFGSLLPGHGGILDRIDSLLINITVFVMILRVFS